MALAPSVAWAEEGEGASQGPLADQPRAEQVFRLIQQARQEKALGRFESAREILLRAQSWQPHNSAVAAALQRVETMSGARASQEAEADAEADYRIELARAEMRVLLRRIDRQITRGHLDQASRTMAQARIHLQQFPWAHAQELLGQLEEMYAQAHEEQRQGREAAAREQRQEQLELALDESAEERARSRSIFRERLERIIAVQQRGHLNLALAQARSLLADYPEQPHAEALFNRILQQVYEQRAASIEEQQQFQAQEIFARIHRALIPTGFDGKPIFPDDWDQRNQRTGEGISAPVEIPEWQEALQERIEGRLSLEVEDIDPVELLQFVAQRTGINMVISPEIRMAGHPPLSLQVSEMRIAHILNWITRQIGTRWQLHRQAVFIGDRQEDAPIIRVYDVREILFSPPNMPGPSANQFARSTSGGGEMGGRIIFAGRDGQDEQGLEAEDIIDLIYEAIDPRAWDSPDYTIGVRNRVYLTVHAPPYLQAMVQEFIQSQRDLNRIMVRTTANWLELTDSYLQEVGVDWRNLDASLIADPALGNRGAQRQSSTAMAASSLVNRLPAAALEVAPAAAGAGLNLHFIHLGATQLSSILTAAERMQRGRMVSSVDLTCFQGQRAHAAQVRQIAYISGYSVDAGGGAGTLAPNISFVNAGSILDIQPFVSADRKYVTMDLRPVNLGVEFSIEIINAITTVADGNVVLSYPLELPNVSVTSVGTRVMIPDGGSLLVGGLTESVRQNTQANLPVVGHIPFLGRLFGKRGRYEEQRQMFLTLSVDIILYDEEEALL